LFGVALLGLLLRRTLFSSALVGRQLLTGLLLVWLRRLRGELLARRVLFGVTPVG